MASFNKIIIVGYLGRDPELRYTPTGNAVCNFSVATTEKRNNRDGDAQETTTWFRVTAWGKQGELVNEYLRKGSKVYVEGRFSLQTWTDRDGQTRASAEVTATDIRFLDRKNENGGGEASRATDSEAGRDDREARRNALRAVESDEGGMDDDEVPF